MRYIVYLFIIFIVIVLGVLIFGHHGNKNTPNPITVKTLPDYASTDVETQLTIDGQINGNESHRQIILTVGRDRRVLRVNQGYQGTELKNETLDNNQDAYSAFLHALDLTGFTRVRKSKFPNEQGQCPFGQRFIYQTLNNDDNNLRTWSTSCNGNGTFAGQANSVQRIFQNQFANYSNFTSDVDL